MSKLPVAIVILSLFVPSAGLAFPRNVTVPQEEVNKETQLLLTQMFIAERGWDKNWKARREHNLLAYITLARYNIRKKMNDEETFVSTLRSYPRALRPDRKTFTQKMMWVLSLQAPESHFENGREVIDSVTPPQFWPENLRWEKHERFFIRTWVNAGNWMRGLVGHPCPGALHWGMPGVDPVPTGMRELACSKHFRNHIYGR